MINAHVIPMPDKTYLVSFTYPDAVQWKQPEYFPATTEFDVQRRLMFVQRKYILDKLVAWLNQRQYALSRTQEVVNIQFALSNLKMRHPDHTFDYVATKRLVLESLAPGSRNSRCYPYYEKHIVPILEFCTNKRNSEEVL